MNNFVIIYSNNNKNNLYKYVQKYCRNHPGNGYNEVTGECKINNTKFYIEHGLMIQNMSIEDATNISRRLGSEYILSSDAYCYKCIHNIDENNIYDFSFSGKIKYPSGYNNDCYYKEIKI